MRYQIADESLRALIKDVWHVHLLDFRLMDENLGYNRKPTDEDRKLLSFIYGEKVADKIITLTYPTRRSYKNEIDMNKEKERIALDFIRDFGRHRASLIRDISRSYEKVIKQKEVARELVVGILHPSSREDFN